MNEAVHVEDTFPVNDGVRLHRRSVLPAGRSETRARLALLHGYGDHSGRYLHVFEWLALRGVACYTFDFRGHGRSTGRRLYVTRWEDYLDDLRAFLALAELSGRGGPPLFILGHSHGGLVLAAAVVRRLVDSSTTAGCVLSAPYLRGGTRIPRLKFAAARVANRVLPWIRVPTGIGDGAMSSDPAMVQDSRDDPLLQHAATPRWYFATLTAQADTLARAAEFDPNLPLLCLAGDADRVADPAAVAQFHRGAGAADKTLRVYPGKLHELLRETGRDVILEDILGWIVERARARSDPHPQPLPEQRNGS